MNARRLDRSHAPRGVPRAPASGAEPITPSAVERKGDHDGFDDAPEDKGNAFTRWVDSLANKIHPKKHGSKNPAGPNRVTHERPFFEAKGALFGVEVGVTVSELHQIRAKEGVELVHVVNPDGSSNLELVLARKEIGAGQRIELQGPALNTSLTPGQLPVGARFVGVGLTSDVIDKKAAEALSYTFEVKATERTAAELAMLVAPGAAKRAAELLTGTIAEGVGTVVAEVLAAAVPVIGAAIALSSARWAIKTCKNPKASRATKTLAVLHAVSDAVRIVFPLAGVIGNAALVAVAAGTAALEMRKRRKAAEERPPPTGPPAEEKRPPTGPPAGEKRPPAGPPAGEKRPPAGEHPVDRFGGAPA